MSDKKLAVDIAADMLNGLDPEQKEKVIELMKEKDPAMTAEIVDHLFKVESLTLLTPKMMSDFLKAVPLKVLGHALKIEDRRIADFFYQNMSARMAEDLRFHLEEEKIPKEKAFEAHRVLKKTCEKLIAEGAIILRHDSDKLV